MSFPVYQCEEWQCRYVFPDQRCCGLRINHDGAHEPVAASPSPVSAPSQVIPDSICGICYHPFDACSHCDQGLREAALIDVTQEVRGEAVKQFRMDELEAVMLSVDKWLTDAPEFTKLANPATRAAAAREIALQAIERLEAKLSKASPAPSPVSAWQPVKEKTEEDLSRVDRQPLSEHGDLPRRETEDVRTTAPEKSNC